MHDWILRMVPASGEPLERDTLSMPVGELTLAHLPGGETIQKSGGRSEVAQSSDNCALKDLHVGGADGDSCSWSGRSSAPWKQPGGESRFRMRTHSSQGNSHSQSDSDVIVSHDGMHASTPGDVTCGDQLVVQGSAHSTGSVRQTIQPTTRENGPSSAGRLSDGNSTCCHKFDIDVESKTQVTAPLECRRMGLDPSASPAEVALQYVQQQLVSQPTGSFRGTRDEWPTAHAFSVSPATSIVAALGTTQPDVVEAGTHRSAPLVVL